jgi:DNA repair protein RecN (Recombination protein N)
MQQMSENCQVLCITHLPQIAALGNQHYKVCKIETEDSTVTQIHALDIDARVQEIANMLSGEEMTEAAISNAKALLKV